AGVYDEHGGRAEVSGLATVASFSDDSFPIGLGLTVLVDKPLLRYPDRPRLIDQREQIGLFHYVLRPDFSCPKSPRPDPTAHRFGRTTGAPGGLRHGQHVVRYYTTCL